MQTVGEYIKNGGTDIVQIMSLVLNKSSASVISNFDYQLNDNEIIQLKKLITKRELGIPFAYLSRTKGFYHLDFKVTESTLIPRPETELLVDIALELFDKNATCDVVDLGTGSGAIAISIADKRPNWNITATDLSIDALVIAKQNKTSDIIFKHGDWLDAVDNKKFNLIVSNPPYVADNDPHLEDLKFEPLSALTSGMDGLDDIRTIIEKAPRHLNNDGYLLLEHGHDQQIEITKLLSKNFHNIKAFKDYGQLDRAVLAQIKNEVGL